ncbi:MAG: hypothetical protein EOO70_05310 [Myxococcaceae bacterium]|nr:MAG: hypothetical protein EOO70_05310 [Myxococcaceae bacterium]
MSDPRNFPAFSQRFATRFSYETDVEGMSTEDALSLHEEAVPLKGTRVVAHSVVGDAVSAILEGDDPVTGLRMRVSFKIVIQNHKIVSVSQHAEIIGKAGGR